MVNNKETFNISNAEHNEQNFRRKWGIIQKIESCGINMPGNNYILTGCIHQGTPIFVGFGAKITQNYLCQGQMLAIQGHVFKSAVQFVDHSGKSEIIPEVFVIFCKQTQAPFQNSKSTSKQMHYF